MSLVSCVRHPEERGASPHSLIILQMLVAVQSTIEIGNLRWSRVGGARVAGSPRREASDRRPTMDAWKAGGQDMADLLRCGITYIALNNSTYSFAAWNKLRG